MVFKSKTMKKGGKVKKTQKRIRGGNNILSYLKNFLPSSKHANKDQSENVSHTTVPDTPTQPTQPTQPMQSMQSMQQMQPVPPQQGGKKKYSKGRKGRKGGMFGINPTNQPQPPHQQPVHQQSPQGFHFFNHPKQVQQPNSGHHSRNLKKVLHEGEHAVASAGHNALQAARRAAHGASQFGQSVKHGVSHLGHNVAEAARKGAIMTPSSILGGSKRKSKKQRKTYKKKYSKAKKSRKMRR